jgi:hypothetical protein
MLKLEGPLQMGKLRLNQGRVWHKGLWSLPGLDSLPAPTLLVLAPLLAQESKMSQLSEPEELM